MPNHPVESQRLKSQIKEFNKQYFTYNLTENILSDQIKQELARLGAFKPFYSEDDNERSILLIRMWNSNNPEVKNLVMKAAQEYFLLTDPTQVKDLLDQATQAQSQVQAWVKKMQEARKNKKYEF